MKIEFYVAPSGESRIVDELGNDRPLLEDSKAVLALSDVITKLMPEAWERCQEVTNKRRGPVKGNRLQASVDRFVRCNFSARDMMPDLNSGLLDLEEVPCHLRGVCEHEGVICKPKISPLTPCEEYCVAFLAIGHSKEAIARKRSVSVSAVKHSLQSVQKKFNLEKTMDIVRFFRGLHLERRVRNGY